MIKNNIKTLLLYIFVLAITFFILLSLRFYENSMSNIFLNNNALKIIIIVIYVSLFLLMGRITSKNHNIIFDYTSFLLVYLIGIFLYSTGILAGGIDLLEISNIATLPGIIFLSPFLLLIIILDIEISLFYISILSVYMTLLIGIGKQFNKNIN